MSKTNSSALLSRIKSLTGVSNQRYILLDVPAQRNLLFLSPVDDNGEIGDGVEAVGVKNLVNAVEAGVVTEDDGILTVQGDSAFRGTDGRLAFRVNAPVPVSQIIATIKR